MVLIKLNNWLKSEYIKFGNDSAIFLDPGIWISKEESKFDKDMLKINVKFPNGDTKEWTLNFTTLKRLVEGYGDDTKNWVGKEVRFAIVQVNIKGDLKDSIVGSPVREGVRIGVIK